jgi:hypothetical protein
MKECVVMKKMTRKSYKKFCRQRLKVYAFGGFIFFGLIGQLAYLSLYF